MSTTDAVGEAEMRQVAEEATFPARWKRNFAANFVDSLFFSLALAFVSVNTIVPLFIRSLGGSALLIGLIPALIQTGHMLPPLFAAPYVAPLPRKLPFLLKMTVLERLPFLLLAILSVMFATSNPPAMLVITASLLAIFGLAGGICLPAWMDIVARVTPLRMRGKLFGWSGALSGVLGVAGGLAAERVLAAFAFPYNFAACFAAASICLLVSFLGLAAIVEPVAEERAEARNIGAYIGQLPALLQRDHDFRIFIFVRVLGAFAGLATAFVAVYATEQRELPASIAGRFTAWMLGAQVIATPIFGVLADRYGYKPSLQFALLAQTVAMALSLTVTTPLGFSFVFALIGASSGLIFATTLNMVVEFAAPAERVTYLGLHGTLIALPTLLAPVLGGWLVGVGGYPLAFVVAALFGISAFALLTWFVRDPRHRQLAMSAMADVP
ncbi:MAG TPA: MFS transporter [Roseiflexaceae bacterium]|nr:MFS transporter [Roseiflexaceae bacterium]